MDNFLWQLHKDIEITYFNQIQGVVLKGKLFLNNQHKNQQWKQAKIDIVQL